MCRVCAIALSFVSGWRAFSSVSLCKYILSNYTRYKGIINNEGINNKPAQVVQACLAPRVWVWGVWIGFALRCAALLCGVFVRLHLALFPSGEPFLPSFHVQGSTIKV
jgi:hypothetical protein